MEILEEKKSERGREISSIVKSIRAFLVHLFTLGGNDRGE